MSFNVIKLKDLIPLREAEEEQKDDAAGEEGGGENPFAAAEEGGGEEEAPAEPEAGAEGGDEEEKGDTKKQTAPTQFPIKFNLSRVKKYNNANFISNQGELKSIDKKGLVVTVQPDNVDIFVNFSDIL